MELAELRKKIDELDRQIVQLINERYTTVLDIGHWKKSNSSAIYVPEREKALIEKLQKLNEGPMQDNVLKAIYREIMSGALALEHPLRISFLGPEGSFTEQAALAKFGNCVDYQAKSSIADIFKDIETERADYGCIPVENSTEGAVTHTLDMLLMSPAKICAESNMRIHHHLMANCEFSEIKKLYSHIQVFGQCRNFIQEKLPGVELVETGSTTKAAALAVQEKNAAAIGGLLAAEKYGLNILMENVEDFGNNTTRFLIIGNQDTRATGDDKTSICFALKDKVGALYDCLRPFKMASLTLTMIESRPTKNSNWEYCFFVDVLGHATDEKIVWALEELERSCNFVKVMGSYPRSL
jgi:chorismate mutase/prephenate dehydratase